MVYETITGDWMTSDGYLRDLAPSSLLIVIVDGRAHDAHLYGSAPDTHLAIDSYGNVCGWGGSYFSPDEGEVDRVGRGAFRAASLSD